MERFSGQHDSLASLRGWVIAAVVSAAVSALASPGARADPPADGSASPISQAKAAYASGTAAFRKGDYALSAREFARADELQPNDVALQAALESAVLADDAALGMSLLERARRNPTPPEKLQKAIDSARQKFAGRAGRVRFGCPHGAKCSAAIDGVPVDARATHWLTVGPHEVTLTVDGVVQSERIEVRPEDSTIVRFREPASKAEPAPTIAPSANPAPSVSAAPLAPTTVPVSPSSGLSPGWFFAGAGLTLVLGALTTWSALDTRSKHEKFSSDRCPTLGGPDCAGQALDGTAAQNRTNVLIGTTAFMGVASGIVGAFLVGWGPPSPSQSRASIGIAPRGATLHVAF